MLNSLALEPRQQSIGIFQFIALGFILSIFILPGFELYSGAPQVRLDDLFVYLMLLSMLLVYPWNLNIRVREYVFVISILIIWMLVTQLANGRLTVISDYFEYYKMFKFIIVVVFFYLTFKDQGFYEGNGYHFLRLVFYGVVFFNLMHYYGLLNFNQVVMPFYAGEHQLARFGLNSVGLPDVKRLLGSMGNPNDNAIIMGFFSIVFINQAVQRKEGRYFSAFLASTALLLLLMTGSRTAFIAIIGVFGLYFIISKASPKALIGFALLGASLIVLVQLLNITYISSLWTDKLTENASIMGRVEIWEHLWIMIKDSPWIGYGPNKEYFYANNIFAESDYVLMTWRYGFPGLFLYLLWLGIPALTALWHRKIISARSLLLFSAFIFISALTNVPSQEPRINVIYALLCGIMYADLARRKKGLTYF
ncbi:MAG: hypothetical protein APF84_19755 [Gracilibacter sp. BRH_c7a]|nr:MAG: hypothetical protein APF84_19755 [Gracilibacter sp. BRH_c7a]